MATIDIAEPVLNQLKANANARQLPLDIYLESVAIADAPNNAPTDHQLAAIKSFASGMCKWTTGHLPAGHIVDDSRDSIYPDRD